MGLTYLKKKYVQYKFWLVSKHIYDKAGEIKARILIAEAKSKSPTRPCFCSRTRSFYSVLCNTQVRQNLLTLLIYIFNLLCHPQIPRHCPEQHVSDVRPSPFPAIFLGQAMGDLDCLIGNGIGQTQSRQHC